MDDWTIGRIHCARYNNIRTIEVIVILSCNGRHEVTLSEKLANAQTWHYAHSYSSRVAEWGEADARCSARTRPRYVMTSPWYVVPPDDTRRIGVTDGGGNESRSARIRETDGQTARAQTNALWSPWRPSSQTFAGTRCSTLAARAAWCAHAGSAQVHTLRHMNYRQMVQQFISLGACAAVKQAAGGSSSSTLLKPVAQA
jgi:hypothetical protein